MSKKPITASMALIALAAFVLPAYASATNDPQLLSGGTVVPVGTSIVGTAAEAKFTNTEGTSSLTTCSKAKLTGSLTKNSGGTVEGEIPNGSSIFEGTGATSSHNSKPECTGSFGNSYVTVTTVLCIKSDPTMVEDEFQVLGAACGSTGKLKFIIGSTTAGACEYEATGNVKGTFTTGGTEGSLTTRDTSEGSGATKISGGFLCPTSGALKMTFTIETTDGTKLTATALPPDDPQLTDNGSLLSATNHPAINATNSSSTEFTTTAGSTLVTCTAATMTGRLLTNSSSTVEGEVAAGNTSFSGSGSISSDNGLPECTSSFGSAFVTVTTTLCIKADPTLVEQEFQVIGAACGSTGKVKFIIGSTTAGECEYESIGAVKGTYTTGGTEAKLSTLDTSEGSGATKIRGGFLCPTSGALKMTFTLETVNPATKLTIS